MQETIQCIALRLVKYSDSASIATLWSRQRGRMSAQLPTGYGREAQRRRAIMMPLGVFEAVAIAKPGQEIVRLSDVRPLAQSPAAMGNPVKSVMSMFLADFLYSVLKESAPDRLMADFLFESIDDLRHATAKQTANFHLSFLYRLGHFLGIEPDLGAYSPGAVFDLKEARYVATRPAHSLCLEGDSARMPWLLSRLRMRSMHLLRLSRAQRNAVLDAIIDYYSMHYAPIKNIPSLSTAREIFS